MNGDYFSSDGGYEGDTETKDCPRCGGMGSFNHDKNDDGEVTEELCSLCGGTGWVDIDEEGHRSDLEARRDYESELMNED